jgi:hypothetical protein
MTRSPRNGDRPPDHHPEPEPDHDPDRRRPADAGGLPDQLALAELANAGVPDVVDGVPPVPINVWRLTDVGRSRARRGDSGLTPQLAVLLLGVFTRPGDLVVDVAADPALAGVARAGARRYLPVHDPADLATLPNAAGAARLALLPWPLASPSRTDVAGTNRVAPTAVFAACHRLLAADGCAVLALVPSATQPTYVEQAQVVIPAARKAGLVYLQHVIITTATAPPSDTETGNGPPVATDEEITPYLNLLVFGPRGGPP